MTRRKWRAMLSAGALFAAAQACPLLAESSHEAWLRYAPIEASARAKYAALPSTVIVFGDSELLTTAQNELIRGVNGMLGETLHREKRLPRDRAIILGTLESIHAVEPSFRARSPLGEDGFWLTSQKINDVDCLIVAGSTDRGVLYGVFALLSKMAQIVDIAALDEGQSPHARLRWVDQWDNLDGGIERGYGGRSIFFENGKVRSDLTRVREYARLLASVGINGCAINNVNADPRLLGEDLLPQIAHIADAFREWGIRIAISIDLSSPKVIGGLGTFDPLDPALIKWWREKADAIYARIPDFGGFVVKADSEGRPGPASYGRTPADAANVIARALKPHSGIVFYRAFVYDHHLDWQNPKNDRARAAYDIFHPLDGKFDDNVIIQIKHGPIDFQVREPVSPLIGGLRSTNMAMELQITQEYTGQQRHLCFLPSMWKEVMDFDLHTNGDGSYVNDIVSGKTFSRPTGGFVGVANVGSSESWLGHPLAMANLYGFGRLAWNPELSPKIIAEEWTRLTFGDDPIVVSTVAGMQTDSWKTYESYTGPLGLQTLTDILGSHYGSGVESSERNGWGQWHRADHDGVGMDRSVATGTGYVGQYAAAVAKVYESVETTPDELLLFFHHVPYTYVLKSGKTVIQQIYDLHYDGAEHAAQFVSEWESLKGRIDPERYHDVLARLEYQAGHAIVWRDAVCNWFLRSSGFADAQHRVGNYPDRIEAEGMQLEGYKTVDVIPRENASGGKAIECVDSHGCTASFRFAGNSGRYEINVVYFDQNNGDSKFRMLVGNQEVAEWTANDAFPSSKIGADTSVRQRVTGLTLRSGDKIQIEGIPDRGEHAALDYVEIHVSPN
jgi:alpha-glucuronidase